MFSLLRLEMQFLLGLVERPLFFSMPASSAFYSWLRGDKGMRGTNVPGEAIGNVKTSFGEAKWKKLGEHVCLLALAGVTETCTGCGRKESRESRTENRE